MALKVVSYRDEWVKGFISEKSKIEGFLKGVAVHHIGSTSVPGLSAKPVIDILIEVDDLHYIDSNTSEFEKLGYIWKGEFGIKNRRFFLKGEDERTHHIHCFLRGSNEVKRHIKFRDYLIKFPEIRDEYSRIKREGVAISKGDINLYMDYKNDFIKYHEKLALKL